MEVKRCSTCKEDKPLSAFGNNKTRKDGKELYCRTCKSYHNRKTRYGLDDVEFHKLYYQQRGRCAVCNKHAELVVDHCHGSKRVRGLLCHDCNTSIGKLGDDITTLENVVKYLKGGQE